MKKFLNEFKEFINRGNVMDLAVAVIMGAAFTAIINAIVNDLFTPFISLLTGGINFASLSFTLGTGDNAAVFQYGSLLQAILNFFVVALVVFFMVKGMNALSRSKPQPEEKDCPYCVTKIPEAATRCPNCTSLIRTSKLSDVDTDIPPEGF